MIRAEVIEEAKGFSYESIKDEKIGNRFIEIYKFLYSIKHCSRCKSQINNYFAQFKYDFIISPKKSLMADKQFILKKGVVLRLPKTVTDYTNSNLTDEIAVDILKHAPAFIKFFEKFPADYQQKSFVDANHAPSLEDLKQSAAVAESRNSTEALKAEIAASTSVTHIKALAEKGDRHVKRAATLRIRALKGEPEQSNEQTEITE